MLFILGTSLLLMACYNIMQIYIFRVLYSLSDYPSDEVKSPNTITDRTDMMKLLKQIASQLIQMEFCGAPRCDEATVYMI